jgi:hypothetical protein
MVRCIKDICWYKITIVFADYACTSQTLKFSVSVDRPRSKNIGLTNITLIPSLTAIGEQTCVQDRLAYCNDSLDEHQHQELRFLQLIALYGKNAVTGYKYACVCVCVCVCVCKTVCLRNSIKFREEKNTELTRCAAHHRVLVYNLSDTNNKYLLVESNQ